MCFYCWTKAKTNVLFVPMEGWDTFQHQLQGFVQRFSHYLQFMFRTCGIHLTPEGRVLLSSPIQSHVKLVLFLCYLTCHMSDLKHCTNVKFDMSEKQSVHLQIKFLHSNCLFNPYLSECCFFFTYTAEKSLKNVENFLLPIA